MSWIVKDNESGEYLESGPPWKWTKDGDAAGQFNSFSDARKTTDEVSKHEPRLKGRLDVINLDLPRGYHIGSK